MASHDALRSPFNDSDADLILRSCDGTDFHVHKVILGKASSDFKSLLELPRLSECRPADARQVVSLTEYANTVENILRLCYPVPRPPIESIEELAATLEAMKKYEITSLRPHLEQDFKALLDAGADPLRMYGIACLYSLNGVLEAAAKLTLATPLLVQPRAMPPEFAHLPAACLFALIEYRGKCVDAAIAQVDNAEWMARGNHIKPMCYWPTGKPILGKSWAWIACRETDDPASAMAAGDLELAVKTWYVWYTQDCAMALQENPKGEVVARTSTLVRALEKAACCSRCAPVAWKDLVDYSQALGAKIDEAISNVRLELSF
ncbi:hypothetical protein BC628DRAFT_1408639 [Trametes gibbosa]|nr:hypothetical protein BC628DRAFT_1408639 [Trametes gibbosa]